MSHRWKRLLPFLLVLPLPAPCALAQGKTVPAADRDAEERRIRDVNLRWLAAVAKKDVQAIAELYAPQAKLMPSQAAIVRGREAIQEYWKNLLSLPGLDFQFETREVKVAEAGDLAYETGTYTLNYDGSQGRVQDRGKYLVVWEKLVGDWKVTVDIDNSDLPAR